MSDRSAAREEWPVFIYALTDGDDFFYIGQSLDPRKRLPELRQQRHNAAPGTLGEKLCQMDEQERRFGLEILDETTAVHADEVEMAWVGWALSEGYPLTNKGMSRRSRLKWYPKMPAPRRVLAWEEKALKGETP